ncbi:ABC transporter substrate-binding protein [Burkholderia anthina]|uniref:ABC transporter substrate-binding protein n=1 Tax=Burkholderia anthina TaxID=179879 RepID=A0A6P2GG33_9BURK|nr:ABC transporter substrate-binding protein [Burkholderia anthina]MBM2769948.1 ABC transporter substrate-binding protein [Burkholderia anthina]VVU51924.1 Fe3 -hydroxamate ABC transporter periplasmic component [Burkholderia anthina]
MVTTVLHDAGGIDAGPASVTRRRALAWCAAAAIGSVGSVAHAAVAASPLSASPVTAASAHGAPRVVVLDWPLTEIVLSLGVVPVGVARPPWYMRVDGDPPLPSGVTDTGLLFQPNFEVLDALKPDLVVITPLHAPLRAMLERIAPTLTVGLFGRGVDVYAAVRDATRHLAQRFDRRAAADALLARADAQLADATQRLAAFRAAGRPVYLLYPIDDRHMSVLGANSLYGGVLSRVGIANAWRGDADPQGATQTGLAALARQPDAHALLLDVPAGVDAQLARGPLWNALPFVQARRVHGLGALPSLGGVVASMRFAHGMALALQEGS